MYGSGSTPVNPTKSNHCGDNLSKVCGKKVIVSCGILSCALNLIGLFLFISGVMYVNLPFTFSHGSPTVSHVVSSRITTPAVLHGINNALESYGGSAYKKNCTYDVTTWETEEVREEDGTNVTYEQEYICYSKRKKCNYCFDFCNDTDTITCVNECDTVDRSTGERLFCFVEEAELEEDGGCFAYDSIVTKLDSNTGDVEDILIDNVQIGDYLLSGINGEYSKVIMKTHYTKYDGAKEMNKLRGLCFDKNIALSNGINNNCVRLTYDHLIYVNGIEIDNLLPGGKVKLGDYLYHTGLSQFVEITDIRENIEDYYRNVITENGNVVINNGFYSGATIAGSIKSGDDENVDYGLIHSRLLLISNIFYRVFSLNGNFNGLWNNYYFVHVLLLPTKSAITQWLGINNILSNKYSYPLLSSILLQLIGCTLLYFIINGMNKLYKYNKIVLNWK